MTHNNQAPMQLSPKSPSSPYYPSPPTRDFYYEVEKGHSLQDYINILLRRKRWIIGVFLAIVFLVGLVTFTRTPTYRSVTMLEINKDNPGSGLGVGDSMGGMAGWGFARSFQNTQYKILESRSLALRVIKVLNLGEHPDYAFLKEGAQDKSEAEIKNKMANLFLGRLAIQPIKQTMLVNVAYQSTDRVMAKKVLDVIADEYMFLLIDRRNESYRLVRNWLDKQLNEWSDKVQEAQKKLYKFGQKSDIYMVEEKVGEPSGQSGNVIYQKFVDLSALLTKAQADKLAKKGQYQQIRDKGPDAPLIVNNPLIATLREQLVTQQSKVSGLDKIYLDAHPEMQAESAKLRELRNRLNAEVKRLQESILSDYQAATRTEKLLQESFAAQKQQVAKLQENLSNYQILKRDAQTNEQLYQALLARIKEANVSSTMVASNVSVIDPATLPYVPFKPRTALNLSLAIVIGLILGVTLAFLVEAFDDTIKSTEDLEKSCHLPLLGSIPSLASTRKLTRSLEGKRTFSVQKLLPRFLHRKQDQYMVEELDLVVFDRPQDPLTEALRHVQTSIMLSVSTRPPAAIMITSPNPSEGKTMVASNLALSFALNERSTVIIDCDLRKPRVHQIFDLDSQPGLTNYLTGSATREEILRAASIPNLTVIPSGSPSPSPANLLNSEVFIDLLAQLRQQFNHIIVDTPPILGFSDARIVSVLVDGALLVTRYNFTHKRAARLAVQLLGQVNAPIMGGVLNDIEVSGRNLGHYNYKYYSKYYSTD